MKGREAESEFKRLMEAKGWIVHHARPQTVKRGPLYVTNSNDLWGCIDLAGIHHVYGLWFVQVTTTSGVSMRKLKVGAVAWPLFVRHFRVSIAEARSERNRLNPRRKDNYFRIHDLGWKDGPIWKATETVHGLEASV